MSDANRSGEFGNQLTPEKLALALGGVTRALAAKQQAVLDGAAAHNALYQERFQYDRGSGGWSEGSERLRVALDVLHTAMNEQVILEERQRAIEGVIDGDRPVEDVAGYAGDYALDEAKRLAAEAAQSQQ